MPNIKRIVIHCADTPDDKNFDAEDIHTWHLERGWDGIGYHYVIGRNGIIQAGRPEYWQGSHVRGFNGNSLGICLIGIEDMEEIQFSQLGILIEQLRLRYPRAEVMAHCELDPNKPDCPGEETMTWLNQQRTIWLGK